MPNPEQVPGHTGYTGRLFEKEIFGQGPEPNPQSDLFKKMMNSESGYLSYEEAARLVKENYKDNPSDPEKRFANDLHATIAEELCPEDYSRLRFYCAVGTPFDYKHGVDAFFEFEDKEGKIHRVTMDASLRDKDDVKADVFINEIPSLEIDENGKEKRGRKYLDQINKIAAQVLDLFEEKIQQDRSAGKTIH